jgi:chemotaxis protein methyltransferase CheR
MKKDDSENIELDLLLEAIFLKYGYDFRGYARSSLQRRVEHCLDEGGLSNISELQHEVLFDREFFDRLLLDLSINVTEMFRDPEFFKTIRAELVPELDRRPFLKIWHAGCATGEEAYSMAIVLQESGLLDKSQVYATDFNEMVLDQARQGIFAVNRVRQYTSNYQKSGGTESFASYYNAGYDSAILDKSLRENVIFADHNLVTDGVFGEMDLILCRNVLIYFTRELQDKAFKLFFESLREGGFLCLGSKESIHFSKYAGEFEDFIYKQKIYRKKTGSEVKPG